MRLPYAFRLAFQSILHEKWINLLSIFTIATGLLFTAITMISIYNIHLLTQKLPDKFSIMAYLKDNISQNEIDNIINTARKNSIVDKVIHIPKEQALKELKNTLKNTDYILEGLGGNPLPDTIEIKLKRESVSPENVRNLSISLKDIYGIDEVEYGEQFLSSIYSINMGIQTIGIVFIIIMSTGMIFVCYSTVKILFYRKNIEIETYKLLGATKGFIRAPFLIEGAVIGLGSGIISLIEIFLIYYLFILKFSLTMPLFKAFIFPVNFCLILPLTGLFIGITGAIIAIGRIRY
ncbi:MAG: ABC transporter permease [Nitrospirae bacterium]|nr:ABC transporter permease [Nitrospirota bacterium]